MSPKPKKKIEKSIPIKWIFPDHLDTKYATNFIVNYDVLADTFQLSFFEVKNPIILGDNIDIKQKMLDKVESVDAVCVANIVIPGKRMKPISDALKSNVERNTGSKSK